LPLLQPWSWEVDWAVCLLFPIAGMIADIRRSRRIHPAWHWGIATMVGALVVTEAVTYSPVGTSLYSAVTKGSAGASIDPYGFPPPPETPLMTGRK
jgi:hypothetical protein